MGTRIGRAIANMACRPRKGIEAATVVLEISGRCIRRWRPAPPRCYRIRGWHARWAYLNGSGESTSWIALGTWLMLAGAGLAIGLLTPAGSAIVGGAPTCTALSWLPAPTPSLFDAALADILIVVVAVVLGLIVRGARSADARMFGVRQIIIGRTPPRATDNVAAVTKSRQLLACRPPLGTLPDGGKRVLASI